MNTQSAVKFQAVVFITEPGKWLLGGKKEVRSTPFDTRDEAQSWLIQCIETNRGCLSIYDKVHGRIKEIS